MFLISVFFCQGGVQHPVASSSLVDAQEELPPLTAMFFLGCRDILIFTCPVEGQEVMQGTDTLASEKISSPTTTFGF